MDNVIPIAIRRGPGLVCSEDSLQSLIKSIGTSFSTAPCYGQLLLPLLLSHFP